MTYDFSKIAFQPFPGVAGLKAFIFDVDEERQILDAVFQFPANENVALHRHVSQTNMLILDGELIIFNEDGSQREARKAGQYFVGSRDDVHLEGGGPNGAIVFYSVRGHGDPNIIEVLGPDEQVLGTLSFSDALLIQASQTGSV